MATENNNINNFPDVPQEDTSGGAAESKGLHHWDADFHNPPSNNDIEKIIEIPPISDMAGVLARAHFKDKRQRIAVVRLAHRNRIYGDTKHQEMLRDYCASTLSDGALGKLLQAFAATKMIAADMFRSALGMPKTKDPERVYRNTDFREPSGNVKEVDNQHV
jgi:hypothetical protein